MSEEQDEQLEEQAQGEETEKAPFPWLMFCVAIVFDLIGLIPFVNFFSETIAGLTLGLWQKSYAPKTDPLLTFFIAKIIDTISLGILPSNIGIVIFAYIKKNPKILGQAAKLAKFAGPQGAAASKALETAETLSSKK